MKKFICFALCIVMLFVLCACQPTTIDENAERYICDNTFISVQSTNEDFNRIVYSKYTKVVYYYEDAGTYGGYLAPYIIYQDGVLYGAIFENGEIVPVPYASTPLE